MESLVAASAAFVGFHFLLSHPLRRPLVARIDEGPFLGLYSIVALASFAWMVAAFMALPPEPIWWSLGGVEWAVATAAMLVGSVLFVGSLFGNPAFPDPKAGGHEAVGEPRGVFATTRHPMMWGFALWALVHMAVLPSAGNWVLAGAILVLALVGAALQDAKKRALQPGHWPGWQERTSYWPFAAQIAGRAPWVVDTRALLVGTLLWLVATWAHQPLGARFAAGVWRWIG